MSRLFHPIIPGVEMLSGAEVTDGSLKFDSAASNHLSKTFGTTGNNRTWTWSCWTKRGKLGSGILIDCSSGSDRFRIRYISDKFDMASDGTIYRQTNALLRDPDAWYHLVAVLNTSQNTADNRVKLYINGEQVTSFNTSNNPSQHDGFILNTNCLHRIGELCDNGSNYDGQMSQVYFIDGQALTPDSFGFTDPLTNTWRPKKFKGNLDSNNINNINRTWSDDLSASSGFQSNYPAVNAFDGIFTSDNGEGRAAANNSGSTLTFSPAGGIVVNNKIEVYTRDGTITVNGGSGYSSNTDLAWKDVSSVSPSTPFTLTSLVVTGSGSNAGEIYAIKIDGVVLLNNAGWGKNGFYLPMDGNSPIGNDKSSPNPPNNGTAWSLSLTCSNGFNTSAGESWGNDATADKAFDGLENTYAQPNGASNDHPLIFVASISNIISMRVKYKGRLHLNDGSELASTSSDGVWYTVSSPPATLTKIQVFPYTADAIGGRLYAVEINGRILKDGLFGNGWTPVDFSGSVALDSPAVLGGKPFLNVTQGGAQAGVGVFGSRENKVYTVTYADDGGGNKYYIDGVKQPTLNGLIRGSTYTFDTVALGSTHPFRLSATSAHGTEYTDGVDATTGTATTITIPHNAPDSLYYYCTAHSGMGSSITGITTNEKLADPYASNCVVAYSMSGGDYSDRSPLLNCTTNYNSTSGAGNINVGLSTISNFYHTSLYFDGSGDGFSTSGADLAFGTGDFTVECWVYQTSAASAEDGIFQISATSGGLSSSQSNTVSLQTNSSVYRSYANDTSTAFSTAVITDKWVHLALVRKSGSLNLFVDGVRDATTISDSRNYTGTHLFVGGYYNTSYLWVGYMQDFRAYKGIAKYISNFAVPSKSPDILPDTPSGVAGGSKLTQITDGAVTFDGTGDKLRVSDSADFNLGTNDFTIEYFVYKNNDMGGTRHHVGQFGTSNSNRSFVIKSGQMPYHFLGFYWYNGSNQYDFNWNEGPMRTQEGWKHVCVQRKSGKLYLYIDGKMWKEEESANAALSINNSTAPLTIGSDSNTGSELAFNGSISNFRLINGTAIYRTGGFVPPTAPLTKTSQGATESEVKLLCCQSNTQAGSAAAAPNVSGVNDGREWSHFTSASGGFNGSYPKYNLFDGESPADSNRAEAASNDDPINIDFSPAITVSSTISLWSGKSSTRYQINNSGSYTTYSDAVGSYKDISHSGSLTNIKILHGSGGQAAGISAIKIDGTQLKDPATVIGDAVANTFSPFTTDISAVRGRETRYCTWNPLYSVTNSAGNNSTFSNGNLTGTTSNSATSGGLGTIGVSSGKWYFEITCGAFTGGTGLEAGVAKENLQTTISSSEGGGSSADGYFYINDGRKVNNDSASSYGESYTENDVLSVLLDLDDGTVAFHKNGISQGTAYTGLSGVYYPAFSDYNNSGTSACTLNCGQNPFKFSPPDGYQSINAANVRPTKVITRPDQYFDTKLYTGDGANSRTISGYGFSPDFLWVKERGNSGGDFSHRLMDAVRGAGVSLSSNGNDSERDHSAQAGGGIETFTSDGFTIEQGTSTNNNQNNNNSNYVAWAWRAGGAKGTFNVDDNGYASASAAGITNGTIPLIGCSVGTKQGFSILKYAGSGSNGTLAHGLSQAPDFFFGRDLEDTGGSRDWIIYHKSIGNTGRLKFNQNGTSTASAFFQDTSPTSSLITVGTSNDINSTNDYILYCWHDVPGLQKFGSYGGADAFVELGFRPAVLIIKSLSGSRNWILIDTARDTFNPSDSALLPNDSAAEDDNSVYAIDFLSNGFKVRGSNGQIDGDTTYVYAAWAESPTVNLYGASANAR